MNLTIKMKDNPSKKEEIDALKLIASAIPEDSYLKTFFCDSLVRWVEINIRDDILCDMYGQMMAESARANNAESKINAQQKEIDELKARLKAHRDEADKVKECQNYIAGQQGVIAALQEERAVFEKNLIDAAEYQHKMEDVITRQTSQKKALEAQILGLKDTLIKIANDDGEAEAIKTTVRVLTAPIH